MEDILSQEESQRAQETEESWKSKMDSLSSLISKKRKELLALYGPENEGKLDAFHLRTFREIAKGLGLTGRELRQSYASIHPLIGSGMDFESRPVFDTEDGYIVSTILASYIKEISKHTN